jgi:hypothetical protein
MEKNNFLKSDQVALPIEEDELIKEEAHFLEKLPSGKLIRYEEIFSIFTIYAVSDRTDSYILIPKGDQEGLKDLVIVANKSGIRICFNKGTTKQLVSNILLIRNCKSQSKFIKKDFTAIPPEIQTTIGSSDIPRDTAVV